MQETILSYLLLSLPESIILSLTIVYLMQIKCSRSQRIIAILFTSIISFVCQVLIPQIALTTLIGSLIIAVVYKAWYDYQIKFHVYWLATIFTMLLILLSEILYITMIGTLGLDIMMIRNNFWCMIGLSVPLRALQAHVVYLLYKKYYKKIM
jgi:hypothetical protein